MRKFLLVIPAILGLLLALGSPAQSAPATPSPIGTTNYNHVDRANPVSSVIMGRTSAGAVPNKSPVDAVPYDVYSKLRPKPLARPWGGEKYGIQDPSGQDFLCTTAFNAEATSGAPYMVTAGHCAQKQNFPGGILYYPFDTNRTSFALNSRFNYDSTGDYAALREFTQYDNDPSQWRGSDGVPRTLTALGNPLLNENSCAVLGNSNKTICGTIINANTCAVFADNPNVSHCNLFIQQSPVGPCAIGGDSGSPVLVGHDGVGIVNASGNFGGHCLIWSTRAGFAFTSYGLFAA